MKKIFEFVTSKLFISLVLPIIIQAMILLSKDIVLFNLGCIFIVLPFMVILFCALYKNIKKYREISNRTIECNTDILINSLDFISNNFESIYLLSLLREMISYLYVGFTGKNYKRNY